MSRKMNPLLVAMLVAACGGGGGDGGKTDVAADTAEAEVSADLAGDAGGDAGQPDAGGDLPGVEVPADGPADVPVGPEGKEMVGPGPDAWDLAEADGVPEVEPEVGSDVVADVEADVEADVVMPGLGLSEELAKQYCSQMYCLFDMETCEWNAGTQECIDACVEKALSDGAFFKRMICGNNKGMENWCEAFNACSADYELVPECEAGCPKVQICQGFGNEIFGYSLVDCEWMCSASWEFAGISTAWSCLDAALTECSGVKFLGCLGEVEDTCQDTICEEGKATACGLIPGEFESGSECAEKCSAWSPGQQWAAQACLTTADAWPVSCAEKSMACLGVPAEQAPAAMSYCQVLMEKCKDSMDEASMGLYGADLCAWEMTGVVAAKPSMFKSFVDGIPCASALKGCPSEYMGDLYCLLNVATKIKEGCNSLKTACTPAEYGEEMMRTCQTILTVQLAFAVKPTDVDTMIQCVKSAATCEEKVGCTTW